MLLSFARLYPITQHSNRSFFSRTRKTFAAGNANDIYAIKKHIERIKNDPHSGAGIGVGVVFFIIGLMLCIAFCQAGRIGTNY